MESIAAWFSQLGSAGKLLFVAAYVVASLLPVPTAPFTLASGVLFGLTWGFLIIMAATMVGSTIAFVLARYVLRERAQRLIDKHPTLKAVDRALLDEGWKAVALLQMSPGVPFGVQNYFLGASTISIRAFLIGTTLGIIPSTGFYVFLGVSGRAALQDGGPGKWALLTAGIAATLVLMWRIGRAARRRLNLAPR